MIFNMKSLVFTGLLGSLRYFNVAGHSWIDCIDRSYRSVYTNSDVWVFGGNGGAGACQGYARGYPGRGDSAIGTKFTYQLSYDQVQKGAPVCQDSAASTGPFVDWKKVVRARAGDTIYFAYFSNGHIVKEKTGRGAKTLYGIYWSGVPGKQLTSTKDLVPQNLVNKKEHTFDDGNCGEAYADGDYRGGTIPSGRAGQYKPCVGKFTIPVGTKKGMFQFVWFWKYFVEMDSQGKQFGASYSSCFDVIVV